MRKIYSTHLLDSQKAKNNKREWKDLQNKPEPYDLVCIKDDKDKCQMGWWTGTYWDFGKKRIGEVIAWKYSGYKIYESNE